MTASYTPTMAQATGRTQDAFYVYADHAFTDIIEVYDTEDAIRDIPGMALARPVPFRRERHGGEYVLVDEVFDRFGCGDSVRSARIQLAAAIADYFGTLIENRDRLSAAASAHYETMRWYLEI